MSELLGVVADYGALFAVWTLGVAALFALSAAVPALLFSRRGRRASARDIAGDDRRWMRPLLVLAAAFAGLTIGLITGVQVGAIKAGVELVGTEGPQLLKLGLVHACNTAGLPDPDQTMSLERVRSAIDAVKDARLVDSGGIKAAIVNTAFDLVRGPFVSRAERLLARHAPQDQISLVQVVDATWGSVNAQLRRTGNALIVSEILTGYLWLGCLAAVALLVAWIVRPPDVATTS